MAAATWYSGQYAGMLLIGFGLDAALGFDFILYVLGFLCAIRDWVEWWQ